MNRVATLGGLSVLLALMASGWPAEIPLAEAQPLVSGTATATGRIVAPETAVVGSRLAAFIEQWGVDDNGKPLDVGSLVKQGQVLFELEKTTFKTRVESAQAGVESAKAAVEAAKALRDSAQAALENLTARTREERLEQLRQTIVELRVRLADAEKDEARFRRLVEEDKTMPVKRLEEIRSLVEVLRAQGRSAEARLKEAETGPTKTEVAMAASRVKEAEANIRLAQARVLEMEKVLQAANDDYKAAVVKAPFSGLVVRRGKGRGDYVAGAPFVEVLVLVSLDRLEADLRLPEKYLPEVEAGKTKVLLSSALLKKSVELQVERVVKDVDTMQGTFGLRVKIPAEQRGDLAPGAFVAAELAVSGGQGVLVPLRAVARRGEQTVVFVAKGGRFEQRVVEVGDRLTEGVVIRAGLKAGEKVATAGAEQLKDGAPVQ